MKASLSANDSTDCEQDASTYADGISAIPSRQYLIVQAPDQGVIKQAFSAVFMRLLWMQKVCCSAGGLGAAFQVTPIQEIWPLPAAEPDTDDLALPDARAGDATALEGSTAPASLGSGQGQSWQMRLVVVQEALALLRALLMHPSLGQLPRQLLTPANAAHGFHPPHVRSACLGSS